MITLLFIQKSFGQINYEIAYDFGDNGYKNLIFKDYRIFVRGIYIDVDTLKTIFYGWNGSNYIEGLMKTNKAGNLITEFGTNGIQSQEVAFQFNIDGIKKLTGNSILIFGNMFDKSGHLRSFIKKWTSDKLDITFGDSGIVYLNSFMDYWISSIVDDSGNLYVCGSYFDFQISNYRGFVARLRDNGEIDSTFGDDGYVILNRATLLYDIIVDDQYIYTVGADGNANNSKGLVCKYLKSGEIDPNFGNNGYLSFQTEEVISEISKIVEVGSKFFLYGYKASSNFINEDNDLIILKISNDGLLDNSFGVDGTVNIDYPNEGFYPRTINLVNSELLVTANYFYNGLQDYNAMLLSIDSSGREIDTLLVSIQDSLFLNSGLIVDDNDVYLYGSYNDKEAKSSNGLLLKLRKNINSSIKIADELSVSYNAIVNDWLSIDVGSCEKLSLDIYNLNGLKLYNTAFTESVNINIARWLPGAYICILRNNSYYESFKIVKI